jgi:hypothetical protein
MALRNTAANILVISLDEQNEVTNLAGLLDRLIDEKQNQKGTKFVNKQM